MGELLKLHKEPVMSKGAVASVCPECQNNDWKIFWDEDEEQIYFVCCMCETEMITAYGELLAELELDEDND